AVFAHPGANIGIITGFGGTRRLPRAIGKRPAEKLFATAERINGERAFEIGLVEQLAHITSALEMAIERGQMIAAKGADFVARIKTIVRLASESPNYRAGLAIDRYKELMAK